MIDGGNESSSDSIRVIVDAGYRQVSLLETIAASLDQRAGVLIGLLAVAITLAFQANSPNTSSPIDLLFWFSGFGLLFASLVVLAASFAPRRRRYGPDIATLYDACLDLDEIKTLEAVGKELKEVWNHNGQVNEARARLFKIGLWLLISGVAVLALDILLVRVLN